MDETIIANWNSVVKPNDAVFHLGDFAFVKRQNDPVNVINKYISRLNGRIHLVIGNHDKLKIVEKCNFVEVSQRITLNGICPSIVMNHYAQYVWDRSHYGTYHCYAHSHGTLFSKPFTFSCDVGVDAWNYTPVSLEQIHEFMMKKRYTIVALGAIKEEEESDNYYGYYRNRKKGYDNCKIPKNH